MSYDFGHPCCEEKYPPASEIEARCFENLDSDVEIRSALGIGPKRKITVSLLQKNIKIVEDELKRTIDRYEDVLTRGDAAMSEYDLKFNYTAQRSGLPLCFCHVGYEKGKLRILYHWLEKLTPAARKTNAEIKISFQLELF